MPSRSVVWTLAILAILLVVAPLLSMTGMMTCCGAGMWRLGGGGMMGMSAAGVIWMLAAVVVVVALVVMLVRGTTQV